MLYWSEFPYKFVANFGQIGSVIVFLSRGVKISCNYSFTVVVRKYIGGWKQRSFCLRGTIHTRYKLFPPPPTHTPSERKMYYRKDCHPFGYLTKNYFLYYSNQQMKYKIYILYVSIACYVKFKVFCNIRVHLARGICMVVKQFQHAVRSNFNHYVEGMFWMKKF